MELITLTGDSWTFLTIKRNSPLRLFAEAHVHHRFLQTGLLGGEDGLTAPDLGSGLCGLGDGRRT